MRRTAGCVLLSLAALWGCSSTVLVPVPPRMELKDYATLGVVEFSSNHVAAVNARATREFQARIHAAQPGTRLLELGTREAVLAAVGSRQLDADALKKIGARYSVDAVFLGEIAYSEPKTNIKVTDLSKLEGSARTEVRGDISSRLVETRTGAAVWSSSAWATRQVGRVEVSAEQGVSTTMRNSDARDDMVPALVFHPRTTSGRARCARRRNEGVRTLFLEKGAGALFGPIIAFVSPLQPGKALLTPFPKKGS